MALKLLQMDYPFSGPWGSEMAEEYSYLARRIADVPGLICKVWTENPGTGEAGGIYLFEDEASLDSYLVFTRAPGAVGTIDGATTKQGWPAPTNSS